MLPVLPVYCSIRILVGASLIATFCALAELANKIIAARRKFIFFIIDSIE